ncbi:hypothetical protein LUZ60_007231 [Juncus effusus]|nr:hypothetical protein LUZ60_007231 [Juncus effusus]
MSMLTVLRLRSNLFIGNIPMQLANLTKLQVLDLGDNNLSGLIPDYLDNMAAMTLPNLDLENNSTLSSLLNSFGVLYYVSISVSTKDLEREYSTTLALLTSIDLSRNNLTGEIPQSITTLLGLRNLNLSYNHLNGTIPTKIDSMQLLQSLDLRRNELSGLIPQSLANLNFLETLNLSYNNLSGGIPTGDQLQTIFNPYEYIGNAYLCGSSLNKSCNAGETSHNDIVKNNDNDLDEILLCLIMVIGFGFGFWVFFGVLVFKRNWRYYFLQMVDNMFDRIYVFVILYFARLRRDA